MTHYEEEQERNRRADPDHPLFAICVHCDGYTPRWDGVYYHCWACNGECWDPGPKIPRPPNRFEILLKEILSWL